MTSRPPGLGRYRHPQPKLHHIPSLWAGPQDARCLTRIGAVASDAGFFHDGVATSAVMDVDGAGITLRTHNFTGAYVSVAVDLPAEMASDLDTQHDLRVAFTLARAQTSLPGAAYLRLSVSDGAEPWQITVPGPVTPGPHTIALGPGAALPAALPGHRRTGWVDLVFTDVATCAVVIRNLQLTRGPMPTM